MARGKRKSEHYVNNKEFLEALINYRAKCQRAPVIPRYIGECFLKIANHLSYKPNFVNYMFREDMISDGIENCVQYIKNFICLFHSNNSLCFSPSNTKRKKTDGYKR